jgi:hypothetical protein|tara:strand:+ start:166 stop:972 length:807 start_codon:yes stop_codon:yes gene_type:complete
MKKLLFLLLVGFSSLNIQAQFGGLPDGSIAPNFTLTDENGVSHNLYDLLDDGKTVYLDFFAVWCPPCWTYKQSGALDSLYVNHGPEGYPNVSENTTDDVMVFSIEGDGNDCSCLFNGDCNTSSQGNYLEGSHFPFICTDGTVNTQSVSVDYQTNFFWPLIYMVCPDKKTTQIGSHPNPYSLIEPCRESSVSLAELALEFSFSPNPVVDFLTIDLINLKSKKIDLYDVSGRFVTSFDLSFGKNEINLSHLKTGLYLFKTESGTKKITKL